MMNPAETVTVESQWSASTPHTFPCTAGVLIRWPLQHALIWSHTVSSPYSAANCKLLTTYFIRTTNFYLWIAWNERNSSSGFIQLFSLFSYLEHSLAPINIFRFFSALAEFVPPAPKMPAVLFISSWMTPVLTLSWSRVFWWRNWAHSSMSTMFALQGRLQASKSG